MNTKPEKKPPKEIQYLGLKLEKKDFRLSPRTAARIRGIRLWTEDSKEILGPKIVGKPGG